MYAFLSLYPDVFITYLLFNAHKRNQLTEILQQFGKMGSNGCYGIMIEHNISYSNTNC